MQVKMVKELYPEEAILKAAQFFTDRYYMSLDADKKYYYVEIEAINGENEEDIEKQFLNEALTQSARYKVMKETKGIRELILGRALASTIIDDSDAGFVDDENIKAEDILNNWFDKYDK